ncbi:MAG TPA: uroporphyrinogen decarboxylase family protein [Bacillota bacterium]|nr:uroporphyrinogen decarboxylase family protein [Bacillota bacterium]
MKRISIDYSEHNEGVKQLNVDRANGVYTRVPMIIGCNPRMILLDSALNTQHVTFEQYFSDPDVMAKIQLQFCEYRDTQLVYDHLMGEENVNYCLYPDFQNILEPNWLGCPIFYPEHNDPAAEHYLTEETKYDFIKQGIIDPFGGIMGRAIEYHEHFKKLVNDGLEYKGRCVTGTWAATMGTDGPFTTACSLLGATDMCMDLYIDTEFAMEFLSFITDNTINRIKVMRKYYNIPEKTPSFGFADDSIALLSCEDYERFILPFHKKLIDELSTGEQPNSIHLCGDATRHFPLIQKELHVNSFDTGFPVDFAKVLASLDKDTFFNGGVHVDILLNGTKEEVVEATKKVLSQVKGYKNFSIRDANNLSPCTPPENLLAMYETVKKYGLHS